MDQISALAAESSSPELAFIPEPMSTSPVPEGPETVDAEQSEHELVINLGARRYRIRGLSKNMSYDIIKKDLGKVLLKLMYSTAIAL